MDTVKFELDASQNGWRCSSCGLHVDCIGRPQFGHENWTVVSKSISWIENKPRFKYCPKCGKKVGDISD